MDFIYEIGINTLLFGLTIFFFFLLPGHLVLILFKKERNLINGFFVGTIIFILFIIFISFFINELVSLKIGIFIFYSLILCFLIGYLTRNQKIKQLYYGLNIRYFLNRIGEFFWPVKLDNFIYSITLIILFLLVVSLRLTHNFHYDDTAHFTYLSDYLKNEALFPSLLSHSRIIWTWGENAYHVNNYSFFVIFYIIPTLLFKVDFIFGYYLWGFFLFSILVVLLDRFVVSFITINKLVRIIFILSFFLWHHDDSLNFGGYPLSIAKLFFYAGIYYFLYFIKHESLSDSLISAGMFNLSWLIHINLIVTYSLFLPFLLACFFIGFKEKRRLVWGFSINMFASSVSIIIILFIFTNFIYVTKI